MYGGKQFGHYIKVHDRKHIKDLWTHGFHAHTRPMKSYTGRCTSNHPRLTIGHVDFVMGAYSAG